MNPTIFPATEQMLFLSGHAGQLEIIASPVSFPQAIAVICHPHPQHGGTMHNKVVTTLHKAFYAANKHTVRFNYRGVGRSQGSYGDTYGEVTDLLTVLAWIAQTCPTLPLYLAGFSFGAYISYQVAGMAAYKNRLKQLISVAPPIHYPQFQQLPTPSCPWLVIQGEDDEVIDANAVFAWLAELGNSAQIIRFPRTGHFFHGKLLELKAAILKNLTLLNLSPVF